jgi:hypothetical protein
MKISECLQRDELLLDIGPGECSGSEVWMMRRRRGSISPPRLRRPAFDNRAQLFIGAGMANKGKSKLAWKIDSSGTYHYQLGP